MKVAVMIMAAGESKRFGGCKLLSQLDNNHSLLSHAVEQALGCDAASVFVVTGRWHNVIKHEQQNGKLAEIPLIYNPEWSLGLGSSIAYGVRMLSADYDGILVTLADQVALRSEDFNKIILSSLPEQIVCASYENKTSGVPALFPSSCFSHLAQLSGEFGARELLRGNRFRVIRIFLPNASHDIDTQESLREWRRTSLR